MSQHELSIKSQISQATISRAESNLILQLKSDALRRLADALGTTTDHLVGKSETTNAEEVLKADPAARDFLELFANLDVASRGHLKEYMSYLSKARANKAA